jgi:hypothetical protein
MSAATPTVRQTATGETNRKLAFGVFAAPVAWGVNEIVNVAMLGHSCSPRVTVPGNLEWIASVVTVCAAIVAGAGALVALNAFRKTSPVGVTRAQGRGRVEFIAQFGFLLSSLLLVNIVFFAFVPWVVQRCASGA